MQPLVDFGGSGNVIHLAVANGFPPQTYHPLLQPLTARFRVVSLPPRVLWPNAGDPPEQAGSWREVADDLLNGLREHSLTNVTAVGHSFGAVASLLAVLDDPARFRGLCLLDPTVFPPAVMQGIKQSSEPFRIPLIEQALARRSQFASLDEAFDYWRGKGLFSDWSDEALWVYTRSMTRPDESGSHLTLTWPPAWEAYYYRTLYLDTWEAISCLNGLLPVLVVQGELTNTFTRESLDAMHERLPNAHYAVIPGHGHLFPHTAPNATRDVLESWLETL